MRFKSLLFLALSASSIAFGQTKQVLKNTTGNTITESLVFGSGKTLTISSGATLDVTGATVTGINTTPTWSSITGKPTTLSGYGITDAQPLDSDLTSIAALSTTTFGRSLLTQADAATARTTLGAGTSSFSGAFSALSGKPTTLSGYGITDAQPLNSGLTSISGLTTTSFGLSLLTQADAATARTTLGAGTSSFSGAFSALSGKPTTLSGYGITDAQPLNSGLTSISGLTTTSFGLSLLTQADAATARTTLGAGTSSFSGAFSALSGKPTTLSGYGITDAQPLNSRLTIISGLTTSFGLSLLTQADAATARTTLGAGTSSFSGAFSALSGKPTTLSGYGITDQAGLQAETADYVARVRAAGGDLDWTTITWIDWLIVSGKRDGWWSLYDEIYIFCGNNLASSFVKLKYGTGTGSSLTNNGFVAADFTQAGGFGIPTGNTAKFVTTGYIPSNFSVSCANISVVATNTNDTVTASASSGNTISTLKTGNAADSEIKYFQSQSGTGLYTVDAYVQNVSGCSAKVHGFAATTNLHHGCINGVRTHNWAQTSSSTLTSEVALFKGCFMGSNNRFGNGMLGTVMLGRYATPTQLKAVTLAVWQFERGIGRTAYQQRPLLLGDGDSITSGQGATNWYDSFYHQIVRRTGSQVFNTGMPACEGINDTGPVGGVTKNGDILTVAGSGTAVVMYGTNDMTNGRTSSAYQTAMTTIVSGYVGKRWNVIVCSPPYSSAFSQSTRRAYAVAAATVAKTYGVPFVDTDRAISDYTTETTLGSYMADSKHPNTLGHTLIADRVYAAMNGRMIRRPSLTFTSVAAASTNTQTVEVLNAVAGNTVTVTPDSPSAGIVYSGTVTSNDTVTVSTTNITAGAITPTAGLVTIEVR